MKPNLMKIWSLLGLATLFICLASITSVTAQVRVGSGFQSKFCQNSKNCAFNVQPLKCNKEVLKYVTVPVSAGGIRDLCNICDLGASLFVENKDRSHINLNEVSNLVNYDTNVFAQNFDSEHGFPSQDNVPNLRQIYDFGLG